MTDNLGSGRSFAQRGQSGPLAPHVDAFEKRLSHLGYASSTRREKLRVVADFSRWLGRRGVVVADLAWIPTRGSATNAVGLDLIRTPA